MAEKEVRYKPKLEQKKSDIDILNWVWQSMRIGRSWKQDNIDVQIKKHVDAYNKKPYGVEQEGRSKFVDSTVNNYVNSVVVNLLEPFANTSDLVRMTSNVTDKDVVTQASMEESLLNYQFNKKIDKYNLLDESIKLYVQQGILATRAYWDFKSKQIIADSYFEEDAKAEYKSLTLDELAEAMFHHKSKEETPVDLSYNEDGSLVDVTFIYTDIIAENPNYVNVPINNMFWNPTAQKISYVRHDLDYVGEVKIMSKSDSMYKLKTDPTYKKFSKEELSSIFSKTDTSEIDNSYGDDAALVGKFHGYYDELRNSFDNLSQDKQVVIEIHGYIDIDNDGIDELVCIEVMNDKIIKLQLNAMPDNMIPYNVALFDKAPFTTYGNSIPGFLEDIQKLRTAIMRNMQDSLAYGTLQNYIVEEGMFDKVNFKRFMARKPGDIIKAKTNIRNGGRLQDKIANVPSDPIRGENFQVYQILEQQSQENSGVTAYTQGMDSSSLNQTATGVSIVTQMSMKRLLKYTTTLIETFIKPTLEGFRVLNKEFLSETTFNEYNGNELTVTKEDIDLDNDITINVAIKGFDAEKVTQMIQFLNMAAPLTQSGALDPQVIKSLIKELAETWELRDIADMINPAQVNPPTQDGQTNPGSPANNVNEGQLAGPEQTTINNI